MVLGQRSNEKTAFLQTSMKIGELAKVTGLTRDTIRLYENMGMLVGVTRPNAYNNYKDYPTENLDRIHLIIRLKNLGLKLKECKSVIQSLESGTYDEAFQEQFLSEKLKEIDEKIAELNFLKDTLSQFVGKVCKEAEILKQLKKQAE
ncbi:MerR family transcriptional regulator [Sediminitomix flava]|uniref:MerR family transcriptional regulator n=2 Tax=Sediminitomix flava TaxID=379075 RepID=A0A315ZWN5_SEDFL|nr:MerR family transcriptional regulator [Sediminitomix flava]